MKKILFLILVTTLIFSACEMPGNEDKWPDVQSSGDAQEPLVLRFDTCGGLSDFNKKDWFNDLESKYASGEYMEDTVNAPGGEGCLSSDDSMFIFIPSDFAQAHGCGRIFEYDIVNSTLAEASGEYCAKEFGIQEKDGNYMEFQGLRCDENCVPQSGKYYFRGNRIEVSNDENA